MSNNEHLTAIKKRAGVWRTFFAPFAQNDNLWYTESFLDGKDADELYADFNAIIEHAEALATALAEAEARGDRLQAALVAQGWYAQALHRLVIAALGHLSEEAIRRRADADETAELCRQHGDIRFLGDVTERPEHAPEAVGSPESDGRGA